MDHATTEAAFTQTGIGAVAFSWNGKVLSIVPNTALAYAAGTSTAVAAKSFTATMGTGAKDLAGNALKASASSTFKTLRRITTSFTQPYTGMWVISNYMGGQAYRVQNDSSPTIGDGFTDETNRVVLDFNLLTAGKALPAELTSIESAKLSAFISLTNPINNNSWGDAAGHLGDLQVKHVYYGDITTSIPITGWDVPILGTWGAILVPKASASTGTKTIDVTTPLTDDFAQRAVRMGRSQYRLQFATNTNGDSELDLNAVKTGTSATLEVVYLIP
jgi:hypothetical protein